MSKKKQIASTDVSGRKIVIGDSKENADTVCPVFCFDMIDRDGMFAFDILRDDFNHKLVLEKMIEYGSMTWSQILHQTHDRGKSKNHILDERSIGKEGWERIHKLKMDEYTNQIFSFALQNLTRVIGIRIRDEFHVVWYDSKHLFCPSHK